MKKYLPKAIHLPPSFPIIYQDKNHDHSPQSFGDSSTSRSTSSSRPPNGILDYDSLSVMWPPQNSISWPLSNYDDFAFKF